MRKTPLQVVKDGFGGREGLVDKLADMVDDLHGDGTEGVKSRLQGLSNQKLLRLYKVEQLVRERFGDRDKLVDHIVDQRKKAGLTADDDFKNKLEGYSKAKLIDQTRRKFPDKPAKRTPDQKLAGKRGKKQRERAMSKLNS